MGASVTAVSRVPFVANVYDANAGTQVKLAPGAATVVLAATASQIAVSDPTWFTLQ